LLSSFDFIIIDNPMSFICAKIERNMFLDPKKPLPTCSAQTCIDCPIYEKVHCHFQTGDLLHFLSVVTPAFVVEGAGIVSQGIGYLAAWVGIELTYFGLVEIRVMCSHCPHYAEHGKTLQCWANYGSPRLWKYRPGPMNRIEKGVFLGGIAMTMGRSMCTHCMNFACPFNQVKEKVRTRFFERDPAVAEAWKRKR
jgi:hypothetical protein